MVTVIGISAITFLTGLLPTWNSAIIIVPILLIILRIAQRLFAGGEWASGSSKHWRLPKSMRGLIQVYRKVDTLLYFYWHNLVLVNILLGIFKC
jgi:hypothetical protein